jgi:hypothetical protein
MPSAWERALDLLLHEIGKLLSFALIFASLSFFFGTMPSTSRVCVSVSVAPEARCWTFRLMALR